MAGVLVLERVEELLALLLGTGQALVEGDALGAQHLAQLAGHRLTGLGLGVVALLHGAQPDADDGDDAPGDRSGDEGGDGVDDVAARLARHAEAVTGSRGGAGEGDRDEGEDGGDPREGDGGATALGDDADDRGRARSVRSARRRCLWRWLKSSLGLLSRTGRWMAAGMPELGSG